MCHDTRSGYTDVGEIIIVILVVLPITVIIIIIIVIEYGGMTSTKGTPVSSILYRRMLQTRPVYYERRGSMRRRRDRCRHPRNGWYSGCAPYPRRRFPFPS